LTDDAGNYKLTTGGAPFGTGAIPGSYGVAFSKTEAVSSGMSLGEFDAAVASGNMPRTMGPPKPIHLIPEKFSDPRTAGFDPVEVKKSGKNNFDFNLETK